MVHFLETNKILDERIVGYRKGHSTTTALLKIRDDIIRAMKEGELTLVMADYSKAFDTVNFKTVLRKMHHLWFSNNFMKWTANYLSNRRQDNLSRLMTISQNLPLPISVFHKAPY
jgi:hypothetical protein